MNMNSNDQGAAQAKAWMNHIEMEREAQAERDRALFGLEGSIAGCKAASASNQVNAPVHASLARLAELVNMLDKQSETLIDRLTPVSRPAGGSSGEGSTDAAQEPQCSLDDALIVMCSRVQSVIDRVNSARHRLCI